MTKLNFCARCGALIGGKSMNRGRRIESPAGAEYVCLYRDKCDDRIEARRMLADAV